MLIVLVSGCGVLDVDNPSDVTEEDLDNPKSSPAMANGAERTFISALSIALAPYSVATDELIWVGSRDAWGQIDAGDVSQVTNEFSDLAFANLASSRWIIDDFISRTLELSENGVDNDREVERLYLYRAIAYITIADMFADFVFSDRTTPGPALGSATMVELYDEAIGSANDALSLVAGSALRPALLGLIARAEFSKGVRMLLADQGVNSSLVAAGNTAAASALASMSPDFEFTLITSAAAVMTNFMSSQVNARLEMTFGDAYVQRNADGNRMERVTRADPITGEVHPHLESFLNQFVASGQEAPLIIVSAREMLLIMAETSLAASDMNGFSNAINQLRDMDGLPHYSGQVDAVDLLVESRAANLFLQGRRLADMYRFGIESPEWRPENAAIYGAATLFPIPQSEIDANPLVN